MIIKSIALKPQLTPFQNTEQKKGGNTHLAQNLK